MNAAEATAVMTAVASIITGWIGQNIGKKEINTPQIKEIRELQLKNLYVPLEKCLNYKKVENQDDILSEVETILLQNLELVPHEIMDCFQAVKKSKEKDLSELKNAVSSFYNWNKKYLGYPYSKAKIIPKFTPYFARNNFANEIFSRIFVLLFGGSIGLFVSQITAPNSEQSLPIIVICGILIIVGLILFSDFINQDQKH
jgi:hypothetical protein